jgi:hypothetical protein
MYAGLIWVVALGGVLLLKYVFDLIDRPILTVLAQTSVLPLVLFGCFTWGCWRADVSKRLRDQRHPEHERA